MQMKWLAWAVMAGLACSAAVAAPVGDFRLGDTNRWSPRVGQEVSPRQYLEQVSVYYFGYEN